MNFFIFIFYVVENECKLFCVLQELYHELHALDRFEQDFRRKQQEEENPSAPPRGANSYIFFYQSCRFFKCKIPACYYYCYLVIIIVFVFQMQLAVLGDCLFLNCSCIKTYRGQPCYFKDRIKEPEEAREKFAKEVTLVQNFGRGNKQTTTIIISDRRAIYGRPLLLFLDNFKV